MSTTTHPGPAVAAGLHYRLECLDQHTLHDEAQTGFALANPDAARPALLRAVYNEKGFLPDPAENGVFRYRAWLPIRRTLPGAGGPVAFRARALEDHLGMERLVVVFSGYWPERGATLETCSFKELEALAVLARAPIHEKRSLVVCSAGNTGRAFLQIASRHGIAVTVVVPESALPSLWTTEERDPRVRLVVAAGEADYYDAIALGETISAMTGYYAEGGARNVARRDGMGTTLLAAAEALGEIPAHYVQAVGSGTGGIGAWEMAGRLREAGWLGGPCRLHLVQNEPFTIMTDAWNARTRELPAMDPGVARRKIAGLHSPVLSNRKPPFGLTGGVYDVLSESGGSMYAVSGREARAAGKVFERLEGCDLDPAAEVALAGLMRALRTGAIGRTDSVALNLTGGGQRRIAREGRALPARADHSIQPGDDVRHMLGEALPRG
jgi:cysteate synthase